MIELAFRCKKGDLSEEISVRFSDVKQVRGEEHPAPWDIGVTITWGGKTAFDHPLSGADPLHALELAAQYAARYIGGRAEDEGGILEPAVFPRQP